jgi:hypothetical protein
MGGFGPGDNYLIIAARKVLKSGFLLGVKLLISLPPFDPLL